MLRQKQRWKPPDPKLQPVNGRKHAATMRERKEYAAGLRCSIGRLEQALVDYDAVRRDLLAELAACRKALRETETVGRWI